MKTTAPETGRCVRVGADVPTVRLEPERVVEVLREPSPAILKIWRVAAGN